MAANILDRIVATKHEELKLALSKVSYAQIEKEALARTVPGDFHGALINPELKKVRVIAEVKKASPSKGIIRADFDPMEVADAYVESGASCISVLTDEQYFMGHADNLKNITAKHNIPCLRKDFIIDEYQILEARAWGASAVLLIVDCLEDKVMLRLREFAESLGLSVLVETHREEEVHRALDTGATLIGVNNRNLRTFETTLETTFRLRELIPSTHTVVSESGISTGEDIQAILDHNVGAVLVGESLMRSGANLLKDWV